MATEPRKLSDFKVGDEVTITKTVIETRADVNGVTVTFDDGTFLSGSYEDAHEAVARSA